MELGTLKCHLPWLCNFRALTAWPGPDHDRRPEGWVQGRVRPCGSGPGRRCYEITGDGVIPRSVFLALRFLVSEVSDKWPSVGSRTEGFCPGWHEVWWCLWLVRSFQHLQIFACPSWRCYLDWAWFPTAAVEMLTAGSADLQTVRKMASDIPVFFSGCRNTLRLKLQKNFLWNRINPSWVSSPLLAFPTVQAPSASPPAFVQLEAPHYLQRVPQELVCSQEKNTQETFS